ncbi:MAG TPA: S41 family peptidase, partial [Longimicrobiales bacterium]
MISLLLALSFAQTPTADDPLWLRYPAISPDAAHVAFTYQGDLYRVAASGGSAIPLTTHTAHDFMPVWSRDGRWLAFASDRSGNFDIYVMPAAGGEARRLTHHSADEYPYAFTPDGTAIIFGASRLDAASSRLFPTAAQPELYQVPVAGGRPLQLLTTPAEEVSLSRDGRLLLYQDRKGGENAWRKHHTSAVARDIWVHDRAAGTHRRLTGFAGEDRSPVFAADDASFFYLSEASGTFNVHRMQLDGSGDAQVTSFTAGPVRFLTQANDGTLAFGHDGRIYTLAPGGEPRAVRVSIARDATTNGTEVVTFSSGIREMAVAPNGKEVAFVYRGDVFVTNVSGAMTKQITRTPEVETGVMFSPDSRTLVYASERDGRWGIYVARRARSEDPYFFASTLIDERSLLVNDHQNFQPVFSPDGKQLAWIEDFTTLRVMDLASKQTRSLLTDRQLYSTGPGRLHFEWSPDSRWLAFDYMMPGINPTEVGLVRADGSEPPLNLTNSGFDDSRATWILGGKALLWRSNRDGMRSLAQGAGTQTDAYAMFLTRDAWERYRLTKEEYELLRESESNGGARADSARKTVAPVEIELDGLESRRARLTIHSSNLGGALVSADGETLFYLARFERGMNLWSTNLRTRETKMVLALNANSATMAWDSAQKQIFLLADGGISKIDPAGAKREAVSVQGEMVVDVDAERAAMFDRVWRRTRDTYYTAGYHGADWNALRPEYEKFLPHIGNEHEFAELLSELLGELNVSHSGARYSDDPEGADATASLGIFFDYGHTGPGVRIVEVLRGGPLDRNGIGAREGTIILAIDGDTIDADVDFARLLNRKADRSVLLTLRDGSSTRDVVVKPISAVEENRLLYTRWVRRNRDEVEERSGGRLGYVHIPGMNDGAYRTTFEEIMGRYADREAVVVDARWNGGGDLVADLAMFLSGTRFFDYTTDTRSTGFEPHFRWTKPSVTISNEAAYSDGHCYSWMYQSLKIGPLVGMPVPGTCTFAGWESLQNGVRWGVPGLGVKDVATGRYLENWQTEPDVRVMNEYAIVSRGRDQQLETAVDVL